MPKKYKILIIAVLIGFFLGSFYSHKHRAPKRGYSDFHCYYLAGKRILSQENIYVIRDREAAEFRYAPIFALLMSGLALVKEDTADTIWFIINFLLLIVSFILLKKLVVREKLDYKSGLALYLLTILGALRFIFHNFDTGQANILVMSSILLGLYFIHKRREVEGGAIFAFSCMIKYTPMVFIPYFILRRKFKLSFIIAVSIVIYFLLPALLTGLETNLSYIKNLMPFLTHSTILDQMTVLDPKNQSLFSMIHKFFTNCVTYFYAPTMPFQSWNLKGPVINLIFIVSLLAIYSVVLYQPKRRENAYLIDYALLLICVVFFNLNAWMHNYILLSPAYFIIIYHLVKAGFKDKIILLLLACAYLLNILDLLLAKPLNYKIYFYSPFTISALITFLALLKIKFSKNSLIPRRI